MEGELPREPLYRIPEWCVYVETPGTKVFSSELYGFFAHLEKDMSDGRAELRLLLDSETQGFTPVPLHLVDGGLEGAIENMLSESRKHAGGTQDGLQWTDTNLEALAQEISPLVSLILYLCSVSADYQDDGGQGKEPSRPTPKRTRKGARTFPPAEPTVWQTGYRMGAALKVAREQAADSASEEETAGRESPVPHVRRAHWHAFWSGQRKSPTSAN